jgi:FAD-dependent monooxygenase
MNMGLADAFDLGWKLAATVKGWGGPQLLASYEVERRPIAELMLHWGKVHAGKLMGLPATVKLDAQVIDSADPAGVAMRKAVDEYMQANNGHNQSFGVEMGHRYESNICVPSELDETQVHPEFNPRSYTPTTHPGYRAPHVFLNDGTAIFDHYGKDFTLMHFSDLTGEALEKLTQKIDNAAKAIGVPLKIVNLVGEEKARKIWGAKFVLVRPDGFVSWHADTATVADTERVLAQAAGR